MNTDPPNQSNPPNLVIDLEILVNLEVVVIYASHGGMIFQVSVYEE